MNVVTIVMIQRRFVTTIKLYKNSYFANTDAHSQVSTSFIAAVKNYPISKPCCVVNL